MRSLKLVSIAVLVGCTSSSPATEPSSTPEPTPPPLACAEELPLAVYCQATEAGMPISGVTIQGVGGVTVRHDGAHLRSLDVKARVLRPVAVEPAAAILAPRDVLFLGDNYCFPAAGGFRCAPLAGGPTTPWIAGAIRVERLGLDRFASIVERENDVFDVALADATGRLGPPLGQATRGSWLGTAGDDTVVYDSAGPPGLHAIAATGGTPRFLGVGIILGSRVVARERSVLYYQSAQSGGMRVDVDTLQSEKLPAIAPAATLVRAGATTLLLDYRSVRVLGANGSTGETLYELPATSIWPPPILTTWAATDDALYVLVLNSPCTNEVYGTRGGGPGDRNCADRPGYWAIVRVPIAAAP